MLSYRWLDLTERNKFGIKKNKIDEYTGLKAFFKIILIYIIFFCVFFVEMWALHLKTMPDAGIDQFLPNLDEKNGTFNKGC